MRLKDLRLINFRNYKNSHIYLNPHINIFIGENAQGKTNILEAMYLLSQGKSFRTNSDEQMINFNETESYIASNTVLGNLERLIEIKLSKGKSKIIRFDKNEIDSYKDLHSGLNIVVFSPDDLDLVKEGPSIRRDFLDREIFQLVPLYRYNLGRYRKILNHRNSILKSFNSNKKKKELLSVFDFQLINSGAYLILERIKFINKLDEYAREIHKNIKSEEYLKISYDSTVNINELKREYIEAEYKNALDNALERDLQYKNTSIGPHRDDLKIMLNDLELRTYGSQGQQRTGVLSIKLAEVKLIKGEINKSPILLLDDVFSELDKKRKKYLIENLTDIQTMITMTDAVSLDELEGLDSSVFRINNGNIRLGD